MYFFLVAYLHLVGFSLLEVDEGEEFASDVEGAYVIGGEGTANREEGEEEVLDHNVLLEGIIYL